LRKYIDCLIQTLLLLAHLACHKYTHITSFDVGRFDLILPFSTFATTLGPYQWPKLYFSHHQLTFHFFCGFDLSAGMAF
jgi:hypothetical protein